MSSQLPHIRTLLHLFFKENQVQEVLFRVGDQSRNANGQCHAYLFKTSRIKRSKKSRIGAFWSTHLDAHGEPHPYNGSSKTKSIGRQAVISMLENEGYKLYETENGVIALIKGDGSQCVKKLNRPSFSAKNLFSAKKKNSQTDNTKKRRTSRAP
jgi:hypothetical protein